MFILREGKPAARHLLKGKIIMAREDNGTFLTVAEVADIIGTTLTQGASGGNVEVDALRARVKRLTDKHPLYAGLEQ